MCACPVEREWKTISKKKGIKKRRENVRDIPHEVEFLSVAEGKRIQQKIKETVEELRISEFWTDCLETIRRAVNIYRTAALASPIGPFLGGGASEVLDCKKDYVDHCQTTLDSVCYGIGNFSSSVSSRYQLALLFLLLETLQIPRAGCLLFDPLFTEWEKRFLEDCGMVVIKENEEGKRSIERPTLFYMIHCGKALYNNLLWKNWSAQKLVQIILVGNSFKGIEERLPARVLQRDYTYISHITHERKFELCLCEGTAVTLNLTHELSMSALFKCPHHGYKMHLCHIAAAPDKMRSNLHQILGVIEEAAFPSSSRYMDVFNDTSIHLFPRKKLDAQPTELWEGAAEPTYQECEDLEIIQNNMKCFSVS